MAALLVGCAAAGSYSFLPERLSEDTVITMVQDGIPAGEIIQKIDQTRTVYVLRTRDVLRLYDAGVPETVIDHMLETYTRDRLAQQRGRMFHDASNSAYQDSITISKENFVR